MRQAAIRQALSAKLKDQELLVVDTLEVGEPKTRVLKEILDRFNLGYNVLFVTATPIDTLKRSARNFQDVRTITAQSLDVYNLLKYHRLVLDRDAVRAVEGVFGS
jgi:large subunit ribosomal protein L4